jgi:lipopolysaccharide export system protein LptA
MRKITPFLILTSVFTVLLILGLPFSSFSADKKTGKKQSEAIRITSDKMEVKDQKGTVVFSGNVVAKKGNLTIYSDLLEVYYAKKTGQKAGSGQQGAKNKRKLKKIVARGHLRIVQGKRRATAREAVYYKPQEKIVLIKDARIWDGKNTIKGDKVTLFVNENRSVVESSGKDRVEAVVYSD